jgi:hypothetical protein
MQLLFEATVTDIPLDLNTYMRLLSQIYFDYEAVQFDRKDFITYLYTLCANDHTMEDFQFASELLQEYIESNFSDFSTSLGNAGKKKRKGKDQKQESGLTESEQRDVEELER